jgi:predicted GNAT family acetyltransferase
MPLRLTRARSPDELDRLAFDFLAAREAEHNLLFGIVAGVRAGAYKDPPYFSVVREGTRVVAVALRTPPFNLVLSTIDDPAALDLIAADARSLWPDLPGVLGAKTDALAFASLWERSTGRTAVLRTAERVFRLSRVRRPGPVRGRLRLVERSDKDTVVDWLLAFSAEALRQPGERADAIVAFDRNLSHAGGRSLYVWDDAGPVSLTGAATVTPNGSRIGPVYTPPDRRGHGYASALVAGVSQLQLDSGRRFCFLFTDLANPTSNRIYQDIGYEPVYDVDEYRFEVAT